jgi:CBS domain-containing protein
VVAGRGLEENAMRSQVQDVMTTTVVTVAKDTPYRDIVALLRDHRIGAVPVLDAGGHVAGVVSETDLLLKEENVDALLDRPWLSPGRRPLEREKTAATVAEHLMTAPAVSVVGTTLVAEAARIMRAHGVKHLPVIDPATGVLSGIVSRGDLLAVYLRSAEEVRDEITTTVLPVIFPGAAGVSVEVRDGVVTLNGTVDKPSLLGALVRGIYGVEGVVRVENRLRPAPEGTAAAATPAVAGSHPAGPDMSRDGPSVSGP